MRLELFAALVFGGVVLSCGGQSDGAENSDDEINSKPDDTTLPFVERRFLSIAAGDGFTCGVTFDDVGICETSQGDITEFSEPLRSIHATFSYACGVTFDGELECHVIVGGHPDLSPPDEKFTGFSAGAFNPCGLHEDGSINCWFPEAVGGTPAPDGEFRAVSAGMYYACALDTDDNATCFGSQYSEEDGPPEVRFRDISVGFGHACGVTFEHSIQCWDFPTLMGLTPSKGEPSSELLIAVSLGFNNVCVLTLNDTVECWTVDGTPTFARPNGSYKQVSAGGGVICGMRSSGRVECWWERDE